MTEAERKRWAGLCVALTGLTTGLAALEKGDHSSARSAINATLDVLSDWAHELQNSWLEPERTE